MKTKVMVLLMMVAALTGYAQHDQHHATDKKSVEQTTPEFKDEKLGAAYGHYIHLKDALVNSNAEEAQSAATALTKSLSSVNGAKKAENAAGKIAATIKIEGQRKEFSTLSDEMASLVKGGKLSEGALYLEYCPMANNNQGAFWLSNEKEVKNPYFGNKMLKCGSVKETIQ